MTPDTTSTVTAPLGQRLMRRIVGAKNLPFLRDVILMQVGSSIFMVAGFVASIVYVRLLGKESYGQYAVILSFSTSILGILCFGQGQSLYVFFSEARAKGDRAATAAVLRNYVNVGFLMTLILVIVAVVMPSLSERVYGSRQIGQLARLICVFQMTEIWNTLTIIILQALRHIRFKVILEQSANLTVLAISIALLIAGFGVRGILLGQLIASAVFFVVSMTVLRKLAAAGEMPHLRDILGTRFRQTMPYLVQGLSINVDKAIGNYIQPALLFGLSLVSPVAMVGSAKLALQFAGIPRSVMLPHAGDLATVIFAEEKAKGGGGLRRGATMLISRAFGLQVLMTLGALLVTPILIRTMYGAAFGDAIPMTLWLLLVSILPALTIANAPILRLLRKMPLSMLTNLSAIVLGIGTLQLTKNLLSPDAAFIVAFTLAQLPAVLLSFILVHIMLTPHGLPNFSALARTWSTIIGKYRTTPRRYREILRIIAGRDVRSILEIGVYRGSRAIEMITAATVRHPAREIEYVGFDLFESLTDELCAKEFSKMPPPMQAVESTIAATGGRVRLFKGFSQNTVPVFAAAHALPVDIIFIDGGHAAETIADDWKNIQPLMGARTLVVFDDYYANDPTDDAAMRAAMGEVGCQALIGSLDRSRYCVRVGSIEDRFKKEWGMLRIRLAFVSLRS